MAFVEQICEGYSKKTLLGNWAEERLYPKQTFREEKQKQARDKDEGITTYDGTGFQRSLPRLQRRTKWETTDRIILNDGFQKAPSVMRAEYPNNQQHSYAQETKKPFDKTLSNIKSTSIHPHTEIRVNPKNYHILSQHNGGQLSHQRNVQIYQSDFKSDLPQHPKVQKFTNYVSEYKGIYQTGQDFNARNRTVSEFNKTKREAGNFNSIPEQAVKPITTLFCEKKIQRGDEKDRTDIQRSWVPSRDKSLTYSMGKTAEQFKKGSIPRNDIQTSLNANIGVHNLHPQLCPDGYFRHVRQDVTVSYNKTFCNRP